MNILLIAFMDPTLIRYELAVFFIVLIFGGLLCFGLLVAVCVGRYRFRKYVRQKGKDVNSGYWPMAGWTFLIILGVLPIILAIVGALLDHHADFGDFWLQILLATFFAGPIWLGITALVHRKMMIRVKLFDSPRPIATRV